MVGPILGQLTYGSIVLHANVVSVLVPSLLPNRFPWWFYIKMGRTSQ